MFIVIGARYIPQHLCVPQFHYLDSPSGAFPFSGGKNNSIHALSKQVPCLEWPPISSFSRVDSCTIWLGIEIRGRNGGWRLWRSFALWCPAQTRDHFPRITPMLRRHVTKAYNHRQTNKIMTSSNIGNVRHKFLQNGFCCTSTVEDIRKDCGWFAACKWPFLTDNRTNSRLSHQTAYIFLLTKTPSLSKAVRIRFTFVSCSIRVLGDSGQLSTSHPGIVRN